MNSDKGKYGRQNHIKHYNTKYMGMDKLIAEAGSCVIVGRSAD